MSEFKREIRYIIIKLTDLEAARSEISKGEMSAFNTVLRRVEEARFTAGKAPLECVVVEKDWPEFNPTWAAIEKRCSASKNQCQCDKEKYIDQACQIAGECERGTDQ